MYVSGPYQTERSGTCAKCETPEVSSQRHGSPCYMLPSIWRNAVLAGRTRAQQGVRT